MPRQRCTPQNPMPKDAPGQWEHEGAVETEGNSDYTVSYECEDCGATWEEELPE